jgi:hypothetical protein
MAPSVCFRDQNARARSLDELWAGLSSEQQGVWCSLAAVRPDLSGCVGEGAWPVFWSLVSESETDGAYVEIVEGVCDVLRPVLRGPWGELYWVAVEGGQSLVFGQFCYYRDVLDWSMDPGPGDLELAIIASLGEHPAVVLNGTVLPPGDVRVFWRESEPPPVEVRMC